MKQFSFALLSAVFSIGLSNAAVTLNEIRIDHPGVDVDEYVEFFTTGLTESLDGHWLVVLGDGTGGSGVVEASVDLSGNSSSLNYFVVAESTFTLGTADLTTTLNFENSDNVTFLLVKEFTGAIDDDLDTDNDGTLDSTPWSAVVDGVALIEEVNPPTATEFEYATGLGLPTVGPEGDLVPGHVYRHSATGAWVIGVFDHNDPGNTDTPGAMNLPIPEPGSGTLALLGGILFFFRRSRLQ